MQGQEINSKNWIKKHAFMKSKIYFGLKNLNDGFDTESIFYFSETDFEIVLNRIEKYGIGIYGIEPWLNGEFYDAIGFEEFYKKPSDPDWYRKAFGKYKNLKLNLQYSISYHIPQRLMKT